ncbi:MAG: hypothetical protein RR539_07920 [Clostridium sp.]|uniref:hypothetical protein n=1 Tax=Clostridium sp. TaxID=1506 RepID=UPI002FC74D23
MKRFKMFMVGVVVAATVIAVGFLIYTIEKIESQSVANMGKSGVVLFTTLNNSSEETTRDTSVVLKQIEQELSSQIPVKSCGILKTDEQLTTTLDKYLKDGTNYTVLELNRSDLIKDKGTITLRVPNKNYQSHKESLVRAEKIKEKLSDYKVNIIESKDTPNIINTYIGIELSSKESTESSKKILDNLILTK